MHLVLFKGSYGLIESSLYIALCSAQIFSVFGSSGFKSHTTFTMDGLGICKCSVGMLGAVFFNHALQRYKDFVTRGVGVALV